MRRTAGNMTMQYRSSTLLQGRSALEEQASSHELKDPKYSWRQLLRNYRLIWTLEPRLRPFALLGCYAAWVGV